MEDSLKGVLVTLTICGLFMTAILSFIILFPQEQGVDFTSDNTYLTINTNKEVNNIQNLQRIENSTSTGFNQWNIEVGFMGSNTVKAAQGGVQTYNSNIFQRLIILAQQVFKTTDSNNPILYTLFVMFALSISYLIYVFIKFIRTGS